MGEVNDIALTHAHDMPLSTANPVALTRYKNEGFTTEGVMSTWFEVTKKNG